MNREHRWHARPAQQLAHVDAAGFEVRMDGGSVRGCEPDAGLDTGWHTVTCGHEGDRNRRARGRDLDPAPAELLYRNVEALFERELVEVELDGSILVGYGDAQGP